jgi:hypothetical protein
VRAANLALKFLLELAALAGFAVWGASLAGGALSLVAAVGLPVIVAVAWGMVAAPKARWRLPLRFRAPFELGVFALAALAYRAAGSVTAAVVFASTALLNAVLLTVFDQWEA